MNNRDRGRRRVPAQRPRKKKPFNKIREEKFPSLKEIPIKVQEAYRTPHRLDQKRNSPST
jgi:hypothetical protein